VVHVGGPEADRTVHSGAFDLHRVAHVPDADLVQIERLEGSILGVRSQLESLAADDDLALGASPMAMRTVSAASAAAATSR
jgi:hypothetical protein